jgi:hypothetical protein
LFFLKGKKANWASLIKPKDPSIPLFTRWKIVALSEQMAPYLWIEFSKVWYFAIVWGLREGKWIFREEKTIFGIPGHKRNVFENRPRDTGHDKKTE